MPEDTIEPFGFAPIGRKKLIAAFDGGRLTSDGSVMLWLLPRGASGLSPRWRR
jgi:hypothetical protein